MSVCRRDNITPALAVVIVIILTTTIHLPPHSHTSSVIAHTRLAARHASLPPAEPRQTTRDTETKDGQRTLPSFPAPTTPAFTTSICWSCRTPHNRSLSAHVLLYIRAAAPLVPRCAVPGLPGASICSSHRPNFYRSRPAVRFLRTSRLTLRVHPSRSAHARLARSLCVVVPSPVSPHGTLRLMRQRPRLYHLSISTPSSSPSPPPLVDDGAPRTHALVGTQCAPCSSSPPFVTGVRCISYIQRRRGQ
ncbi:hypothetical protein C8Q78DRAFT_344732 [Trametes maxima]|nr:hypothetical protein C8Q78DRAFT_344732 [Trametes maxima]